MMGILPGARDVREAYARIAPYVTRTPLVHHEALSEMAGGEVHLKLESQQVGGSFKVRGALNALLALTPAERAAGVVASSAGNHGIGVAIAARLLDVRATVFVPASAPEIKRAKIAAEGATVDATAPHYDAAEDAARAMARRTGAVFVSPCTGHALLAGAGTVALEIVEQASDVRTVVIPVGGGGLAGGVGGFLRAATPGVRLLGAQSVRTNAMALALAAGHAMDIPALPTLAEGLAGRVDDAMYAQGKAALDVIVTVEESAIAEAMAWLERKAGLTVEGSAAVGVAAVRSGALTLAGFPAVLVLTGSNVDSP